MTLSKRALALASGILWGVVVFVATIYVMIKGGGNTLVLLQQFFWGYSISFVGAILGLIYGFIWGFILGWIWGLLYNAFVGGGKEEKAV
ncbi:MAG: hypothetical protein ACOZAL_01965 [Patescibacteria group bacterium]